MIKWHPLGDKGWYRGASDVTPPWRPDTRRKSITNAGTAFKSRYWYRAPAGVGFDSKETSSCSNTCRYSTRNKPGLFFRTPKAM